MVGAYPDPPSHRLPYDRDGSTAVLIDESNNLNELSQSDIETINNEATDEFGNGEQDVTIIVLFSSPKRVLGYYLNLIGEAHNLQVSSDTTNGQDGTWTTVTSNPNTSFQGSRPDYRDVTSIDEANVVGIRASLHEGSALSTRILNFHLYGQHENETPALMLWDPDSDQRIAAADLDWGDVQQGTTDTKRFRVKNLSADMLAEGVTLSDEALTDTSPTYVGQHDFSDDGGASFADPLDIGDLSPGEISGELLLRRDIASDAELGVWALRVLAQATAWSEVS